MNESEIGKHVQVAASTVGARLFRNNCGTLKNERGQYVHYGLGNGSSDYIGFKPVKITSEMIGRTIAQFVAAEVKKQGGKPTKEQLAFIDAVVINGGLAGIVHSEEEVLKLLK